ncbi:MAG: TonB-dependent receptor [Flavobacteriaceae bacterium]|nr:TonB-dependent receptor [Flavobacteriaceae bacterium]
MNNRLVLIFLLFLWGASAQEVRIVDIDTGDLLGNVAIYNKDKSKTALADFDGKAQLDVFDRNEKITFHLMGYQLWETTKNQIDKRNGTVYLMLDPQQLDEVVMSISKWEQQKKDIPQKVASITARDIAFTNPQTAADLLQNSGQVFVQKSQLGGGSPMIRGFATNRLLLSVDGVRMNNAIFRGGNLQNVISIDPYSIASTEVIFGPGSVIYGSDAIGGVMNFMTRPAQFAEQDSLVLHGNANYRFASGNGEQTVHADVNVGKKKLAFYTSASFNNFGDLRMGSHGPDEYLRRFYVLPINGTDQLVANSNPQKQRPTAYDQVNLMQKIAYEPNNNWRYDLGFYFSKTSSYSRYDRLIRPNDAGDGLLSADWYYGPQKWFMSNFQVYKKGRSKFYDGIKLTLAYQQFEESRNDRDFGDAILNRTAEKVDVVSANLDFENKKLGNLRLYYGTEYIFNKVGSEGSSLNVETGGLADAPSRYPDGSSWQSLAGYISGEFQLKPNLSLLGGLRYSHVWLLADFDTTFYSFPFTDTRVENGALTGSIGMSWFPKADWQITLNGSTGFRSPNIDDVGKIFDSEPGSVVVPNPDLLPEYAYNAEFGIMKNFNDKVVLKGAAFYTYLVDALVRRDFTFNGQSQIIYNGELSNVQAIQNAARAYVYGFEIGLDAMLSQTLSLKGNLTFTDGIEEDDSGVDTPARHAAPTFGDLHLIWKKQGIQTDFFLNYNGEIAFDDLALTEQRKPFLYAVDTDGNPYSPSWYTLNIRSQWQVSPTARISATLENITDQRYRSYSSGIAASGFNFILGLHLKF